MKWVLLFLSFGAFAQEIPALPLEWRTVQNSTLTVDSSLEKETPEATALAVAKLEARAIVILRAPCTKPGCLTDDKPLTLAEAREKVTFNGKTNIALCLEYVIIDALNKITQANVTGTVQQRLVPPAPEPTL